MTPDRVQQIVETHYPWMYRALRLAPWDIALDYWSLPVGRGECETDSAHRTAAIILDPDEHDTADEVLMTLLHELLHVRFAVLDVYHEAVSPLLTPREQEAVDSLYMLATEQIVGETLRLLREGLGLSFSTMRKAAQK